MGMSLEIDSLEIDSLELRTCAEKRGLDFNYYIEVTKHLVDTFKNDKIVDIPRLEEDLKQILSIIAICLPKETNTHERYRTMLKKLDYTTKIMPAEEQMQKYFKLLEKYANE